MAQYPKIHRANISGGDVLTDAAGKRYRVSDWSPATGSIFGHPFIGDTNDLGPYGRLPFVLAGRGV